MKPSIALRSHKQAVYDLVIAYQARHPKVFGSVLFGYDHEWSDLNIFIEPEPGTSLDRLAELHAKLEQLLQVKVDLVTPKDFTDRERFLVLLEAKCILEF